MDGPARFPQDHANLSEFFDYPDVEVINRGGRNITRYQFTFTTDLNVTLEEGSEDDLLNMVTGAYNFIRDQHPNHYYRIVFVPSGIQQDNLQIQASTFGTAYRQDPIESFLDMLRRAIQNYDEESFQPYHTLMIEVTQNPTNIAVRNGYSQTLATRDYLLLSPHSRINCAYTAIAICKCWRSNVNILKDHITQNQAGQDIKRRKCLRSLRADGNVPDFTTVETIEMIAKALKVNIIIYDNQFKVFKNISVEDASDTYRVQNRGGHMWAMLPREEVADLYPDFKMPAYSQDILPEQLEKKPYVILPMWLKGKYGTALMEAVAKGPPEKEFDGKIGAWDIEAYLDDRGNFVPYMVGFVKSGSSEPVIWKGEDCLSSFISYLEKHASELHEYTLYAHNGASFDVPILLKYTLLSQSSNFIISADKFIVQDGNVTSMQLDIGGSQITFRDSMRLLTGSLDSLTREFNVEHKKLTDTIDHNTINATTWRQQSDTIEEYLRHDCLGLLEVMESFAHTVFSAMRINVTSCISAASMAKQNFFTNYYDPYANPIYYISTTYDKYIRRGYFGGRVECGYIGTIEADDVDKIYYMDFTSLYPDQGRKPMPYGQPKHYVGDKAKRAIFKKGTSDISDTFKGFCECYVKGPINYDHETMLPVHGVIYEGKLVFPVLEEPRLLVLGSEEMKYARKMGIYYEYDVVSCITFKCEPFMKKVYEDAFERKAQAKKDKNPVLCTTNKLIANSTYGTWGFRAQDRDQVLIGKSQKQMAAIVEQKLADGRLKTWANHGSYTMIRTEDNVDIDTYNVSIAAFTTMYSRMRIHSLLCAIKRKRGKVFYWDTDSVITDLDVLKYPDLKKEFMWDGCGDELGSLKNECLDLVEKALLKAFNDKEYVRRIIIAEELSDHGQLSFDKVTILGCKSYCLSRSFKTVDLPPIFKAVLKGIRKDHPINAVTSVWDGKHTQWTKLNRPRKIQESDYHLMAQGGAILQSQQQFRSGNQFMLSELEKGGVRRVILDKAVKRKYTKGHVDHGNYGFVTPLRLRKDDFAQTDKLFKFFSTSVDLDNIKYAVKVLGRKRRKAQKERERKEEEEYLDSVVPYEEITGFEPEPEEEFEGDEEEEDALSIIESFMQIDEGEDTVPKSKKQKISF